MPGHAARRSTTVGAPRLPLSKKSYPLSDSSVSTASKPASPSKSLVIAERMRPDQMVVSKAEGMRPDQMVVSKTMTKNPVFVMADTLSMMNCRKWYKMMLKLLWWLRHSATGASGSCLSGTLCCYWWRREEMKLWLMLGQDLAFRAGVYVS